MLNIITLAMLTEVVFVQNIIYLVFDLSYSVTIINIFGHDSKIV